MTAKTQVQAALARILAGYDGPAPRVILIMGSGLSDAVAGLEPRADFGYEQIPGFPSTSIEGHEGRLSIGRLQGLDVAVLRGREHYYERGRIGAMTTALRALREMGAKALVTTNAVGSLHPSVAPGSLVVMSDHINLTGANPLIADGYGAVPFVDMTDAYDPGMRQRLLLAARQAGLDVRQGVYAFFSGPSFETAAEIRAARILGADTVGMSVAPETVIARHAGLQVAAVSVVTNFATGVVGEAPARKDGEPRALGHDQTMDAAAAAGPRLRHLIESYLRREAAFARA
ncbi:MAG: purine-nucleoside phosphorylase [Gammaproteobacteria bacterium]|nr:purine-nucleoside phosphorylase [Gammaproteobacteria bacterium]